MQYERQQAEKKRQDEERKRKARAEAFKKVREKYTLAHDTTILMAKSWLVMVQPHGGGVVTVDLQQTAKIRDSENWIKGGSSEHPGKEDGWADIPPQEGINNFKKNEWVQSYPSTRSKGVIAYKTKEIKQIPLPEPQVQRQEQDDSWWEKTQNWWHENITNHDWSNNPLMPKSPVGGGIPMPLPILP